MRIAGTLVGAVTGIVLIFVALFFGGVMGCCGVAGTATPIGTVARILSTPGFFIGGMLFSIGVPDFFALILGGAGPGAVAGLGIAELIRARRRGHATP